MPNAPVGKKRPTGRPPTPRAPQRPNAARARAAEAERKRRSRVLYATLASAVVIVLIVVLIVVKVAGGGSHTTKVASGTPAGTATPASVTASLASVPAAQLAQASAGGGIKGPTSINGTRLGGDGKLPEVLYVGAGYCPFCAAERWPLITALLKFGTFTGLSDTHSSPDDVNPNTPTFSFHGATYASRYVTFTGIEETTSDPNTRLDTPTAAQQALLEQYTHGTIPFIYLDGRYLITGAQFDGSILLGHTVEQVATEAAKPSSPIGASVQAAAGTIVKALCNLTGGQPGNVCSAFSGSGK